MGARRQTEEIDLPYLLQSIRQDTKFKTFKKIVETAQARVDFDKDRNEVFSLHAGRPSRTIRGKKNYSSSALMDAAAADSSGRSRMVEIRMKASYHIEAVEEAVEAFSDHVLTEYNEEIRKYSTEAQRKALLRRTQKVARGFITEGKSLLSLCDALIADIDKSSYHLTNMTSLLDKLTSGKVL